MTAFDQLYEKLSAEYAAFINELISATPDKIIECAYEKVFKEDILMCFECGDSFSEKQIAALLALDYPLDALYHNWLDTDVSYMDDLCDTISSFATREAKYQSEIDSEELAIFGDSEAPADKKLSIGDRIAAGNEKARAYHEQKKQSPGSASKHKKKDVL